MDLAERHLARVALAAVLGLLAVAELAGRLPTGSTPGGGIFRVPHRRYPARPVPAVP